MIAPVLTILKKHFKNPGAMELEDPFKTLVGVLLSARTRDEQVLKLLPTFFKTFPNAQALAKAKVGTIESHINTIGMYRQKAKHLKSMATDLVEQFNGEVPQTIEELVTLAGVGRKTASVVISVCFKKPSIAVDTHVHRVTNRLGWVNTSMPAKTEVALSKILPATKQQFASHLFVKFGRSICLPQTPRCYMCPIKEHCAYKQKNTKAPKNTEEIKVQIAERERDLEALRQNVINL